MSIAGPIVIAMAGAPGVGKSMLRKQQNFQPFLPAMAHVHCPDTIMAEMPGYRELAQRNAAYAFKVYEMPARINANNLLEQALNRRENIIYDRSCALPDCFDFFAEAQERGYIVKMHGVIGRPEYFMRRVRIREAQTNRHLPEETMLARHVGFAANYEAFIKGNDKIKPLDEVRLWHSVNNGIIPISTFILGGIEVIEKQLHYNWFRQAAVNQETGCVR